MRRQKIIFLITEDWFFLSHFLERARAALAAGYEVVVGARDNGRGAEIVSYGLRFAPLPFERRSAAPGSELRVLRAIKRLYSTEKPDLVHHVALKPIIYGTMAARGRAAIVNAPVGMGFVYSSWSLRARSLRPVVDLILGHALKAPRSRVVLENRDDFAQLTDSGIVRASDALLIRGAGVDVDTIVPHPEPPGQVTVTLVARMLRDKGVAEFAEAARQVPGVRFVLVGAPDPQNPASFTEDDLRALPNVEWQGFRSDIPRVLAESHIVALPSYREGLPKALLEAMASGRPVVATDVPGCREAIIDGVNGLLVPPRDASALAAAIAALAQDRELRGRFGSAGRMLAERDFSVRQIARETLAVYRDLLGSA